jgi:hypothetical protein
MMRSVKATSAFLLLLAACALAPPSALAANETVLCKANQVPCEMANQYASGTSFTSGSIDTLFVSETFSVECQYSTLTDKTTAVSGNPLQGEITSLNFEGCVNASFGACTVTALDLPWKTELSRTTAPDGSLEVKRRTGGEEPRARVKCGLLNAIKCVYGAEPTLTMEGGTTYAIQIESIMLFVVAKEGTVPCVSALWFSEYSAVTNPFAAFVSRN